MCLEHLYDFLVESFGPDSGREVIFDHQTGFTVIASGIGDESSQKNVAAKYGEGILEGVGNGVLYAKNEQIYFWRYCHYEKITSIRDVAIALIEWLEEPVMLEDFVTFSVYFCGEFDCPKFSSIRKSRSGFLSRIVLPHIDELGLKNTLEAADAILSEIRKIVEEFDKERIQAEKRFEVMILQAGGEK